MSALPAPPTSFQHNLRRHRLLADWTQAQLATALSVHRTLVARWESGERTPDIWEAVSAAGALGVPVSALVLGTAELPCGSEAVLHELISRGAPLLASGSTPVWALRSIQETVAGALALPDPRVIAYLPGLLLLEVFPPRALWGLCADWGVERRLGWILDIALELAHDGARTRSGDQVYVLTAACARCRRPDADDVPDALGFPAEDPERLPPVFKRWRITYDGSVAHFAAAAKELAENRT